VEERLSRSTLLTTEDRLAESWQEETSKWREFRVTFTFREVSSPLTCGKKTNKEGFVLLPGKIRPAKRAAEIWRRDVTRGKIT
jgi:hypothetical protein